MSSNSSKYSIAVDFDGTIVDVPSDAPFHEDLRDAKLAEDERGETVVPYLERVKDAGAQIIVWTSRVDLADVRAWLDSNGVPYDAVNANPSYETGSRKIPASVYVDDRGVAAGRGRRWDDVFSDVEERVFGEPRQPEDSYDGLKDLAGAAVEEMVALLHGATGYPVTYADVLPIGALEAELAAPGGKVVVAPIKKRNRAEEKVDADYDGDWSRLLDVVRASVVCSTVAGAYAAADSVRRAGAEFVRMPKDRFRSPLPSGYRDLLCNYRLPCGMVCEVQYHVKPMFIAREREKVAYDVVRAIQAFAKERGEDKLTPSEAEACRRARHESEELYARAWREAQLAGGSSRELKKAQGAPCKRGERADLTRCSPKNKLDVGRKPTDEMREAYAGGRFSREDIRRAVLGAVSEEDAVKILRGLAEKAPQAKYHGMEHPEDQEAVTVDGVHFQWVGERGAKAAWFTMKSALDLPDALWRANSRVVFTEQRNRADRHWELEYGIKDFKSTATGGDGAIVVYNGIGLGLGTLAHESGHNLAKLIWGDVKPDIDSEYGELQSVEPPVTEYARASRAEDFAEACMLYCDQPDGLQNLKSKAPRKAACIARMVNQWSRGLSKGLRRTVASGRSCTNGTTAHSRLSSSTLKELSSSAPTGQPKSQLKGTEMRQPNFSSPGHAMEWDGPAGPQLVRYIGAVGNGVLVEMRQRGQRPFQRVVPAYQLHETKSVVAKGKGQACKLGETNAKTGCIPKNKLGAFDAAGSKKDRTDGDEEEGEGADISHLPTKYLFKHPELPGAEFTFQYYDRSGDAIATTEGNGYTRTFKFSVKDMKRAELLGPSSADLPVGEPIPELEYSRTPWEMDDLAKKRRAAMSAEDLAVVQDYTHGGMAETLNAKMRKCPPDFKCVKGEYRRAMEALNRLSVKRLPKPIVVWRGVSVSKETEAELLDALRQSNLRKSEFSMPSITSTSYNPIPNFCDAANILFCIKAKTGLPIAGANISRFDEQEFIQGSHAKYRVKAIERAEYKRNTMHALGRPPWLKTVVYLEEM